jgi:hypothetical protein
VERLRAAGAGSPRRALFENLLNWAPVRPLESIFTPTGDTRAPVPIARLIDRDTFGGQNFEVLTLTNIGVAEYTNGIFLSDDTIFSDLALPRRGSLGADFFEPEGDKLRRYFEKVSEGQGVRHFVAESALYEPANAALGRPMDEALILTRRVYEDYAAELIPRAVGYSAALLDYFSRGTLDFTITLLEGSSTQQQLRITNTSAEDMQGTFTLYADDFNDVRRQVDGAAFPITLKASATSDPFTVSPPSKVRVYVLVFQGKLGKDTGAVEDGAVAGKVKRVPVIERIEPNPAFAGDPATIVGSGFDPTDPAKNLILFGTQSFPATAVDAAGTRLTFIVPDLPPPGPVTITSLNPSIPPLGGGTVTITGTNFAGVAAPLRVLVGDAASNPIDFSPGGATRALVTVLTQFDTPFFFNLGNGATHPVPATVVDSRTAVATIPSLFDLAPPPDPNASTPNGLRTGFIRLRLKLYDGSASNPLEFAFPQITVFEAGLFQPEPPVIDRPPVAITVGDTINNALSEQREFHFFEFQGQQGQQITITLDGQDGLDPEFLLSGPGEEGLLFEADDDSGPGLDALVKNVTLPATGTYTIEVRSSFDTGFRTTGSYTLTVKEVLPPTTP